MDFSSNSKITNPLLNIPELLEHISDGFFALDPLWQFTYINGKAERLLDCKRDQVLGQTIWNVYPEFAGSIFQIEYEKSVAENRPVQFEGFFPPANTWLSVATYPTGHGLAVYFRDLTDRRKSHSALQAVEERFRNMVENLPAGAVFRDGDRVWLNKKAQKMVGYDGSEIKTLDDWFNRLYPDEVMCVLTNRAGDQLHIEFTGYLSDVDEFWILHDVTGRRLTEEKFRILFEYTNTAYFLFGPNGIVDCNATALNQLGLSRKEEAIGRTFLSLSPDYQEDGFPSKLKLEEVNRELEETGQASFEWKHIRSDGTTRVVFVSASKIPIDDETMELVVWQDLTMIKEAEERLRQSESQYRTIIENTDEIIYTLSLDGRFTFVSPSWTRHLGHSVDEVIGRRFVEFVHPEDRSKGLAYTLRLFQDPGFRGSCDYRARHKDGSYRWHETSGSVVFGPNGGVIHFVGLSQDVTSKLEAKEALEVARDAALASSRAKSQFLATVSHEIRTPLNGVFGMTNLLADTELTETQRSYVRTIQSSGEILRRVIDDVLDYSRIEAGKLTISPIATDAISALHDVVSLFQGASREKGIALALDCSGIKALQVYADPARMKQVVANLVSNAVKFTEVGGVRVVAKLIRETSTAVILRIEVVDTGIGIKQDRADAIFEGFTQADNSMHRRYGGSGLGLTISKRITDLMGGTMGVQSQYGSGSTFWVELPLSKIVVSNAKLDPIGSSISLEGLRVLLAEDNLINVEVAKIQIEKLGCSVMIANDGLEALNLYQNHEFDVVLMDVQMPEMDGLESTRQIRAYEQASQKHTPIIALTATAFAEDKRACEDAGMDGFLSKPFKREELELILREWAQPAN